jgi:hypothetical protein
MLVNSFYVTTVDEKNHEHNYRFPQGESLSEKQTLKSQREAGNFKLGDALTPESLANLKAIQ